MSAHGVPGRPEAARLVEPVVVEVTLTAVVVVVGALEVTTRLFATARVWPLAIVLCMAVATATSRRLPAVALVMAWVVFALQLLGVELMWVQLAVAFVAFGCARWGSLPTVVASVLSAPLAAGILLLLLQLGSPTADTVRSSGFSPILYAIHGTRTLSASAVLFVLAVSVPWLAGIALRYADRARTSAVSQRVAESAASQALSEQHQAEEIARLREGQAQLARDVHDVVGHSLAVILAQAEAGQFTEGREDLRRTLATIATSARSSLRDVRQVLTETDGDASSADLDALVDGVRASGHEVVVEQVGSARPLPPDLAGVAYRVMQEMLTNAMNHGHRGEPIRIEQRWADDLRLETRNVVRDAAPATTEGGQGISGMRRRLESVGGHLDVRPQDGPPPTFTVTAWVPVRPVAR